MGAAYGKSTDPGDGRVGLDAYGRGEYDPESGLYEWYDAPDEVVAQATGQSVSWADLLEAWASIEADLLARGVDTFTVLDDRPWSWLRRTIRGLLQDPSTRTHRALRG